MLKIYKNMQICNSKNAENWRLHFLIKNNCCVNVTNVLNYDL